MMLTSHLFRHIERFRNLLLSLPLVLLTPSEGIARDPEGTLYLYVSEETGEELVSPSVLEDEEHEWRFEGKIFPKSTTRHASKNSKNSRWSSRVTRPSASLEKKVASVLPLVEKIAPDYGIEPLFVLSIIYAESYFDPNLTSPAGAGGLMQLMPSIARHYGVKNVYDPAQNVRGGCALLQDLLKRYDGDIPRVLAAYSAGDVAVKKAHGVPSFSRPYIARVVRAHARLTALSGT